MPYSDDPNRSTPRYGNTGVGPPSSRYPSSGPGARPPPAYTASHGRAAAPPPVQYSGTADTEEDSDYGMQGDRRPREVYENEPVADEEQPRRQFKYSSANMARDGNCRKYFCIALMFLLFMAFSIGLSILIDYLFFREEDTPPQEPFHPPVNNSFMLPKSAIDSACGLGTYNQDGGASCKVQCQPQWSDCCEQFRAEDIYDTSALTVGSNPNLGRNYSATIPPRERDACSMDDVLQGCVSYSKCIASVGKDPAPAALHDYCGEPYLSQDPETCRDLCDKHRCCYGQPEHGTYHCLADKFEICVDYAPCQALKKGPTLVAAPPNLDQLCFENDPECDGVCEQAECCNADAKPSCFEDNFIACLTYAACSLSNFTKTNITVPERFSVLDIVPRSLDSACNERHETVRDFNASCEDMCEAAKCCYDPDPAINCFREDPFGCVAYDQECQVLRIEKR